MLHTHMYVFLCVKCVSRIKFVTLFMVPPNPDIWLELQLCCELIL